MKTKTEEIIEMRQVSKWWEALLPKNKNLPVKGEKTMAIQGVKVITVRVPGTGGNMVCHDRAVKPGTIVMDLMIDLGLDGYELSKGGERAFRPQDNLYKLVEDGDMLFAVPAGMEAGKSVPEVKRSLLPLHELRGWKKTEDGWSGVFVAKDKKYFGYMRVHSWGGRDFFVMNPPIMSGLPHGGCLIACGEGWFVVHWRREPEGLDSFIVYMESWLSSV